MRVRTSGRIVRAALAVVGLIVRLPAILFGTAIGVAGLAGYDLGGSEVRPCVTAGLDLGLPLTLMGVMGWVVMAFLPLMALTRGIGPPRAGARLGRAGRRAVRAARGGP